MWSELLSDLRYRLRALFRRAAVERELAEELEMHLELEAERLRREGLPPDEARRRARLAFGGVEQTKEMSRDARGVRLVEQVGRDLGHALRLARRQPGFAAVVALSLALGLGATTAVYGITYNVLLAPLALPHPEQLVALTRVADDGGRDDVFAEADYRALRETPGVGTFAAFRGASQILFSAGGAREYINLHLVDGAFFPVTGVRPLHGRLLGPEDEARQAPVVVVSEQIAGRLFPGEPLSSVIGRTVEIRGTPFAVVGVTPRSFRGLEFPGGFSAAVPHGAAALIRLPDSGFSLGARDAYEIVGRLAVGREAAAAALGSVFGRCCASGRGGATGQRRIAVLDISRGIPSRKGDVRAESRATLVTLLAGMGLVLVVVCCNLAGLLLVRASARQREIAVRMTLGASRGRLVGQLVLESVPLALAGGVGGLLLAAWCTAAFVRQMPPDWDGLVELARFRAGPATLAFAAAATLACTLAFAVYPALRATRRPVAHALRSGARASRTRSQGAVARGVVVAQVAVTVVLVTAAALLAATLRNLSRADGGFDTERVLLASLETRSTPHERAGVVPLHEEVGRRVRGVPGVLQAVMSTQLPLYGGTNAFTRLEVPGSERAGGSGRPPSVRFVAVEPGYFAATGIRLLAGRDFAAPDGGAGAEPVAIASAAFARAHFGDGDPVGRTIFMGIRDSGLHAVRIVGVAADARYFDLRAADGPMLYRPLAQLRGTWRTAQLWVRTRDDPMLVARAVLRAVEAAAPGIQVRRARDMAAQRDASVAQQRLAAKLATFVSVMALVLAAVGLYGVVAYGVQRRTTEIGIRLALGAPAPAILWLVARETILLVGVGVAVGAALSFAATSAMASQLFGIGAHDPVVAAASVVLLAAAALGASVVPAHRAVRIDPRIALSAE